MFVYLAVSGLEVAHGIFSCGMQTLSCRTCDLVPRTGIERQAPCIGITESQPVDHQGHPSSNTSKQENELMEFSGRIPLPMI